MKIAVQLREYTIWWLDYCKFGQRICAWVRFGRVNTIVQKSEDSSVLNNMPTFALLPAAAQGQVVSP